MRIQNVQQNTYGKQNNKNQNTYNQSFRGFAGKDILEILAEREAELTPQIIKRLTGNITHLPDNVGIDMIHTGVPMGGYDLYLRDTNYPKAFSKSYNRGMKRPGNIWRSYTDHIDCDSKPSNVKKPETISELIEIICNMLENPTEVQKGLSDVRKNQKERIATRNEYTKLKKYAQKHEEKINSLPVNYFFAATFQFSEKIKTSQKAFKDCDPWDFVKPNFTDNLDKIFSLSTKQYKYELVDGQSKYFEITNPITDKTACIDCTRLNDSVINMSMPPKKFAEEFEKLLKEIDTPKKPEIAAEELLPPPVQNASIEEQSSPILTGLKNWYKRHFDKETRLKLEKASQLAAQRENVKTINEQLQILLQDEALVAKANKLNLINSKSVSVNLADWIKIKSEEATKTLSHDISINFPQNFRYVLDSDLNEKNLIRQWQIEDTKYGQIYLEKKLTLEKNTHQPSVGLAPFLDLSKTPEKFKKHFDDIQREFFAKIAEREASHDEILAFQQLVK